MTAGQQHIRDNEFEIITAVVRAAIADGSHQAAKFLFEYAGIPSETRKAGDAEEKLPGPSLAQIVLAKLATMEESAAQPAACSNV